MVQWFKGQKMPNGTVDFPQRCGWCGWTWEPVDSGKPKVQYQLITAGHGHGMQWTISDLQMFFSIQMIIDAGFPILCLNTKPKGILWAKNNIIQCPCDDRSKPRWAHMNNSSNNNSKRMKCRFQKLLEYDILTYVPKSIMLFLHNTWISKKNKETRRGNPAEKLPTAFC